jgi:predicted dehydrogenase
MTAAGFETLTPSSSSLAAALRRPRLAFVGVGWIGTHRLKAVVCCEAAEIIAIADANADAARNALDQVSQWAPNARLESFERVLEEDIDGIVIATPSAQHAEQARAALDRGLAVFCQKPLARTEPEARDVIAAARANDRLLGVDLSYRKVAGVEQMKSLLASGAIGEPFAVELLFHNAYGPDKPWFYDVTSAGGGCVIDLGIHLIDLLLWMLDHPAVERVSSELYCHGSPLRKPLEVVEDYAHAELRLAGGASARLACSWKLSAGCDAVIEASFFGTQGSVRLRNVNGSFYDFRVEHCEGTRTRALSVPARTWGSVTICEWARQLASEPRFDPEIGHLLEVHRVLDAIYGRSA